MNEPTDDQRTLLNVIWQGFRREGRWPSYRGVDVVLNRMGLEARPLVESMPPGLMVPDLQRMSHRWFPRDGDEFRVQITGLAYCEDTEVDLALVTRLVRYLADRERAYEIPSLSDPQPLRVSSAEVQRDLGLTAEESGRAYGLLTTFESRVLNGGSGSEQEWNYEIDVEEVRRYREVTTVDEYLAVRREADRPQLSPLPPLAFFEAPAPAVENVENTTVTEEPPSRGPSAFVSYAHEDREFVLALIEALKANGLDIRYDSVVLRIGDSLLRTLAREIADGDFLIAVVSPDSVESSWCQKELALAATQGIDAKRVKVLPVRYRGAQVPDMLGDLFYGDADKFSVETLASQLAAAVDEHLHGSDASAREAAESVQPGSQAPAHPEAVGDAGVALIEEVAQRAMDVFDAWEGVWNRGGNLSDLSDPKRRLRWALDTLSDRARVGLPLVRMLAESDDEFFAGDDFDERERDVRAELLAVRTRVAQGLPVVGRWLIAESLGEVGSQGRDVAAYAWRIQRGSDERSIVVFISRTAMASANAHLPEDVASAKETLGRTAIASVLGLDDPPREISVTTAGVSLALPD